MLSQQSVQLLSYHLIHLQSWTLVATVEGTVDAFLTGGLDSILSSTTKGTLANPLSSPLSSILSRVMSHALRNTPTKIGEIPVRKNILGPHPVMNSDRATLIGPLTLPFII